MLGMMTPCQSTMNDVLHARCHEQHHMDVAFYTLSSTPLQSARLNYVNQRCCSIQNILTQFFSLCVCVCLSAHLSGPSANNALCCCRCSEKSTSHTRGYLCYIACCMAYLLYGICMFLSGWRQVLII